MKPFLFTAFLFSLFFAGDVQGQTESPKAEKTIFSIGADLVPIGLLDGFTQMGFGGSAGLQFIANPTTSFFVNAGYILYSNYPGNYGSYSDDLEYIPISVTLRKHSGSSFYFGPRAGFNIDATKPYDPPLNYNKFNFFGGFSFGVGSTKKRFNPDFSLLYHSTVHGGLFTFQSSLRFQF